MAILLTYLSHVKLILDTAHLARNMTRGDVVLIKTGCQFNLALRFKILDITLYTILDITTRSLLQN